MSSTSKPRGPVFEVAAALGLGGGFPGNTRRRAQDPPQSSEFPGGDYGITRALTGVFDRHPDRPDTVEVAANASPDGGAL